MQYLDTSLDVTSFEYEKVKIPYVSNTKTKKIRNYFPDFLIQFVDGTKHLVEIKPARRVTQAKVQKKFKAAELWCIEQGIKFVVMTEVELKALSLI